MANSAPPARRRASRPETPGRKNGASPSPAPAGAKLVCTAGPASGSEFALTTPEAVIGRAADNAIHLPDTSVSRKHASIKRKGGDFLLEDLGSGNGTLLNGELLSGAAALRDADKVTVGDSELTFFGPGEQTDQLALSVRRPAGDIPRRSGPGWPESRVRGARPAPPPRSRRAMLLLTLCTAVLAVGGAVAWKRVQLRSERAKTEAEQARRQIQDDLQRRFQEGKNLARSGKWSEAKVIFDELGAAEVPLAGIEAYQDRAARELPNEQKLSMAAAALEQKQLPEAAAALALVADDTNMFQQLADLKTKLETLAGTQLAVARNALAQERFRDALQISEDILRASPNSFEAKQIREDAQSRLNRSEAPTVPDSPPTSPGSRPWERAVDAFRAGDVTGALAMAETCAKKVAKCKELSKLMKEFSALHKRVEELDGRQLERLIVLGKQITEQRGCPVCSQAATRICTAYYRSASNAKAAGQWGRAMSFGKKVAANCPGHAEAEALVFEARQRAKDTFMAGYTLKDTSPDEACGKFRDAMQMATPDEEYHQKAKTKVDELCK